MKLRVGLYRFLNIRQFIAMRLGTSRQKTSRRPIGFRQWQRIRLHRLFQFPHSQHFSRRDRGRPARIRISTRFVSCGNEMQVSHLRFNQRKYFRKLAPDSLRVSTFAPASVIVPPPIPLQR